MRRILHSDLGAGVLLAIAAALALVVANSPWGVAWAQLWHHPLALGWPGFVVHTDARHIVDDGLMTLFFLGVGLEIRRELHDGAIADRRRAALPAAAALGGMLVPAGVYLAFNPGGPGHVGWGIPMATDIAFAIGVLALLGDRVSPGLRVILLAIAILDDIGGIVVIALAYSSGIAATGLFVAAAGLVAALGLQRLGVRAIAPYLVPGCVTWFGLLHAGIHPTMAGVVMGLATPPSGGPSPSPSQRVSTILHPWVVGVVLPLFALANAGIVVELDVLDTDVVLGVFFGLVLGKPVGVLAGAWLAVRTRVAALPPGVGWSAMAVVAVAAGVGFTVALFIGALAFPGSTLAPSAKLGVLLGSLVAAVATVVLGRARLARRTG